MSLWTVPWWSLLLKVEEKIGWRMGSVEEKRLRERSRALRGDPDVRIHPGSTQKIPAFISTSIARQPNQPKTKDTQNQQNQKKNKNIHT